MFHFAFILTLLYLENVTNNTEFVCLLRKDYLYSDIKQSNSLTTNVDITFSGHDLFLE